jgi:hypothetical protein
MITNLELVWSDRYAATIELEDNPVSRYMVRCVKHLQHLPLEFNHRDNPLLQVDTGEHQRIIGNTARALGISVDHDLLCSQDYLNQLHNQYLKSYTSDSDPAWLPLHDALHAIEDAVHRDRKSIWVDYKEQAGPLIRPFDRDLLRCHTASVVEGDCCVIAHDLGKNLWHYYRDQEPRELSNICAVVRPWQYLRPVLSMFYQSDSDLDRPYHTDPAFRVWVDRVGPLWARHYGILDWSPTEIHARLRIGRAAAWEAVFDRFARGDVPVRLRLQH